MSTCCNQSFPSNKWLQVYGGTFKKEVSLTMCMINHCCCPNSSWILSCGSVFLFSLGWGFLLFSCFADHWVGFFFVQTWIYPVHATIDLSKSLQVGLKLSILLRLTYIIKYRMWLITWVFVLCGQYNKCFVDPFALNPYTSQLARLHCQMCVIKALLGLQNDEWIL